MKITCKNLNTIIFFQSTQWTNDKAVAEWLEKFQESTSLDDHIQALKKQTARQEIHRLVLFCFKERNNKSIHFHILY